MSGITVLQEETREMASLSLSLPSKSKRRGQPSANQEEGSSQTQDLLQLDLRFSSL